MGGFARRILAAGAVAVLTAAGTVAMLAGTAGAQIQTLVVNGELISFTENVWDVTAETNITAEPCIADPLVTSVTVDGTPVTIVEQTEIDPTTTRVRLPQDAPAGTITWEMSCEIAAGPTTGTGTDQYASAAITKIVEGDFAPDTVFVVNVNCPAVGITSTQTYDGEVGAQLTDAELNADFSYPVEGGTLYVFVDQARDCNITEPGNGGATSTVIDPVTLTFPTPSNFDATITNTLVVPEPIVVTPTFTG